MTWFQLRASDAPWGDYGRILTSGMTERRGESDRLPLLRTGPFVPPVTIAGPSNLVVTDAFRRLLEASELKGMGFAPVIKKRIVKLDWRSWDTDADHPQRYPAGGEPENYILGRKHNTELADEIGAIWEVLIDRTLDEPNDAAVVRAGWGPFSRILVDDDAHRWFVAHSEAWLSFEPLS